MQKDKSVKERKLSQAFLNPVRDRLKKWIDEINADSLDTFSDLVVDECNKKEQAANECLDIIDRYYMGHFNYADVQKAISKCEKLGFR